MKESFRLLERIRTTGKQDLALFYDWEADNPGRRMVSPTATGPAATRLIALCESFLKTAPEGRTIDLLTHSAGTVVANKAAIEIARTGAPVRFRRVLLLGTALDAAEPLTELKRVSDAVLNVHSVNDKVNRNINDRDGILAALTGAPYMNLRTDNTLSGRIVRHYAFLADDPENGLNYGTYLGTGSWPEPIEKVPGPNCTAEELHRLTLRSNKHAAGQYADIRVMLPEWLNRPDPEARYYAAIMSGLLKEHTLAPQLKEAALDQQAPVFVRKELYQALGNLQDGRHIDFLRSARKRDGACSEVLRDVLRALKRNRIGPVRDNAP